MCAPPEQVVAWHWQELLDSQIQRHWHGITWHLGPLIRSNPSDSELHVRRARAYAELGRWNLAASHYENAIERGVDAAHVRNAHALTRLAAGDAAGYRKFSLNLLAQLNESDDAHSVNMAVWACVLLPDTMPYTRRAVLLVETLLTRHPDSYAFLNTLGASCYRSGQFESAVHHLTRSIELEQEGGSAWDWLFMALAHQRLGHSDDAEMWLKKATEWIDRETNHRTQGPLGARLSWEQRLELETLRHEAEMMLRR